MIKKENSKTNVLLIGRWGKTHAVAQAFAQSENVRLFALMDKLNKGIADLCEDYELCDIKDIDFIEDYVEKKNIQMLLSVPELSLAEGVTDYFNKKGIPSIGPSEFCTKLEGDKVFLRNLMKENRINAYPEFNIFFDKQEAVDFIENYTEPFAVKPAGITEGDGVKVMGVQLQDKKEAIDYVREIFDKTIGGIASVMIEKKITGEEYTIQFFSDGKTLAPMPAVRDYKLLNEGDTGLNSPGMGSYTCSDHLLPFLSESLFRESQKIIEKILNVLKIKYNEKFKGILSGQYMLTKEGVKLIEINVRPGDSEILNITPILKTDFMVICKAIYQEQLDEIDIEYENKATVCKYVVPEGFPTPKGHFKLDIDYEEIEKEGAYLFQSCFNKDSDYYNPSPRLFAVTAKADDLQQAYESCEMALSSIKGERVFHRRDIGTQNLVDRYKQFNLPVESKSKSDKEITVNKKDMG